MSASAAVYPQSLPAETLCFVSKLCATNDYLWVKVILICILMTVTCRLWNDDKYLAGRLPRHKIWLPHVTKRHLSMLVIRVVLLTCVCDSRQPARREWNPPRSTAHITWSEKYSHSHTTHTHTNCTDEHVCVFLSLHTPTIDARSATHAQQCNPYVFVLYTTWKIPMTYIANMHICAP